MAENCKHIATSYFNLWKAHKFEDLRLLLADDITFIGALGTAQGIEECMNGLQGLTSIITDIVIQHMWIDESDILTWYELHTTKTNKPLPIANWMHIEKDKIQKIHVTFDPRPLIGT